MYVFVKSSNNEINEEWKSRTNRELEELSTGENIVKWIKWQRMSWLGHLERMEEDRMPKKIFTQELEGTRRKGRPRKRWKEEVEDLQVLGVRRWRELVADRKKWKELLDRPKPTVSCSANGRRRRRRRNNEITLNCYSDIIANRNLGCRNALAQRFRIAMSIRSYFRGIFCLP